MTSINFTIQRIILQKKEKLYKLEHVLQKTLSPDVQKSIMSQIKDQKKGLKYSENLGNRKMDMDVFLH